MKTILVVDDDADFRDILGGVLEYAGYRVWTACNGKEAVELVRQNQPDLILMDLLMPEIDGAEVVTCLQNIRSYANMPIVFISGVVSDSPAGERTMLTVDGREYLAIPKTVGREEILRRVKESLSAAGG